MSTKEAAPRLLTCPPAVPSYTADRWPRAESDAAEPVHLSESNSPSDAVIDDRARGFSDKRVRISFDISARTDVQRQRSQTVHACRRRQLTSADRKGSVTSVHYDSRFDNAAGKVETRRNSILSSSVSTLLIVSSPAHSRSW